MNEKEEKEDRRQCDKCSPPLREQINLKYLWDELELLSFSFDEISPKQINCTPSKALVHYKIENENTRKIKKSYLWLADFVAKWESWKVEANFRLPESSLLYAVV